MVKQLRIVFLILLIGFSSSGFGQVRIGLRSGLSLSTFSTAEDNIIEGRKNQFRTGFHGGIVSEFSMGKIIKLECGFILTTKGTNFTGEIFGFPARGEAKMLYVDIPFTIKSGLRIGKFSLWALAGPYLGIGLSGSAWGEIDGNRTSDGIKWGNNPDKHHFKRLDGGIIAGFGIEYHQLILTTCYYYGMNNISVNDSFGIDVSNRVVALSAGYYFNRVRQK